MIVLFHTAAIVLGVLLGLGIFLLGTSDHHNIF